MVDLCFCTVLKLNALIWWWHTFCMPWSSKFGYNAIQFQNLFYWAIRA